MWLLQLETPYFKIAIVKLQSKILMCTVRIHLRGGGGERWGDVLVGLWEWEMKDDCRIHD